MSHEMPGVARVLTFWLRAVEDFVATLGDYRTDQGWPNCGPHPAHRSILHGPPETAYFFKSHISDCGQQCNSIGCLSRKWHCIRPSTGRALANSAPGSNSLVTPAGPYLEWAQGRRRPLWKSFRLPGHCSKNLPPSQKRLFAAPGCPKLVMGLYLWHRTWSSDWQRNDS